MKKSEKNLGWAVLIVLAVLAAILSYLFVPMTFSAGAGIFGAVSFFVGLGYYTFVEVDDEEK